MATKRLGGEAKAKRAVATPASRDEPSPRGGYRPKAYSYVRMSTKEQLQGDSLDRQYERTDRYIAEKNLELVKDYEDIGVSGFAGRNEQAERGLGQFLLALRENLVAPGSYLVIESMDRLTRQTPMTALALFHEIVHRGITVVTLDDGMEYSSLTFHENQYKLFMALGKMMRAHEESVRKSDLISSVWRAKRGRLRKDGSVMTRMVPAWLRVNKTKGVIEPIPERVSVIKEIFDLACNGYGIYSIAKRLEDRGEPAWGTTRTTKLRKRAAKPVWRDTYIKKILTNRAVLGEFQPHKVEVSPDKKKIRTPDGKPLTAYYPQVITPAVFREAQLATESRRNGKGGRKGVTYANLFTGMIHCPCGSRMRYLDKGGNAREGKYLRCSVALAGGSCKAKPFRYVAVEQVVLASLEQLDMQKILTGDAISKRVAGKKALREADLIRLEEISRQSNNLNDRLATYSGKLPESTFEKIRSLDVEAVRLRASIDLLSAEIESLLEINPVQRLKTVAKLMAMIYDEDPEKRARSRRALAGELQRMIDYMVLERDVEAGISRDAAEKPWNELLPHIGPDELEKHLRDFGFTVSIRYRNDDLQLVRGVGLVDPLKLKSNAKFARMKAKARFKGLV